LQLLAGLDPAVASLSGQHATYRLSLSSCDTHTCPDQLTA
jgi:hypothetical protein